MSKDPISMIIAPYIWVTINKQIDYDTGLITLTQAMNIEDDMCIIKISEIIHDQLDEGAVVFPEHTHRSIATWAETYGDMMVVGDEGINKSLKYRLVAIPESTKEA